MQCWHDLLSTPGAGEQCRHQSSVSSSESESVSETTLSCDHSDPPPWHHHQHGAPHQHWSRGLHPHGPDQHGGVLEEFENKVRHQQTLSLVVWADDSSTDFSIFWATWSLQQGSTEANENIYRFLTTIFSSFCFTVEAVSQPHSSIHKLAVFCIHSYLSRIKQEFPHLCWTVLMSLADSWSQSFPVTFSRRSQNNCHNPSPNPKSKSKVKSQKSEDLEWLYSAVIKIKN